MSVRRAARAAFQAQLQGLSTNSSTWISGNLMGWQELDYIPCRVYFNGGPALAKVITGQFDHMQGTTPGIEDLSGWTTSSNVVMTAAPVLTIGKPWSYTFTINLTNSSPGYVEFRARLSAGSHLNVGSALGPGGSGS